MKRLGPAPAFDFDLAQELADAPAHGLMRVPKVPLHRPEDRAVAGDQLFPFGIDAGAHAGIRMVPVAPVTREHVAHQSIEARAIGFEVALEGAVEKNLRLIARD